MTSPRVGLGKVVPPLDEHVFIYFIQKAIAEQEAVEFLEYYNKRGWVNETGFPIKNWKTAACDWIWMKLHGT